VCEVVIHQLSGVQGEVSIFEYQIRNTSVEVTELWDLSAWKKLIKMIDLFAYCVVVSSELMWTYLNLFCTLNDAKKSDVELLTY